MAPPHQTAMVTITREWRASASSKSATGRILCRSHTCGVVHRQLGKTKQPMAATLAAGSERARGRDKVVRNRGGQTRLFAMASPGPSPPSLLERVGLRALLARANQSVAAGAAPAAPVAEVRILDPAEL